MPQKRPKLTLPTPLLQSHNTSGTSLQPANFPRVSHLHIPAPSPQNKNLVPSTPRRVVTFSDIPEVISSSYSTTFSPTPSESEGGSGSAISSATSPGQWNAWNPCSWSPDDSLDSLEEDRGGFARVYSTGKDWDMTRTVERSMVHVMDTDTDSEEERKEDSGTEAISAGGQGQGLRLQLQVQRAAMHHQVHQHTAMDVGRGVKT
ncbi:hypothetical protein BZA77DRAFT_64095 [Pyronema omphalodes]|nr:hypothetical protein BZA77DRAFT_64095 [Pyronema omphalodes]